MTPAFQAGHHQSSVSNLATQKMATASDKRQQPVQPHTCSQNASSLQSQAVPDLIADTLIASSQITLRKPIHQRPAESLQLKCLQNTALLEMICSLSYQIRNLHAIQLCSLAGALSALIDAESAASSSRGFPACKNSLQLPTRLNTPLSALTDAQSVVKAFRRFPACKKVGTLDHQDDQTLVSMQQMVSHSTALVSAAAQTLTMTINASTG